MERELMEREFTELKMDGGPYGECYRLTFDFNEIVEAEKVSGENLFYPLSNKGVMTAGQMRALLYAALKPAHPKVLLSEAGDLLTRDSLSVTAAVARAIFDVKEEEAAAEVSETVKAAAASVGLPASE